MTTIIVNNVVEGDNPIQAIITLQYRRDRKVLGILVSIFTLFIFDLICSWVVKLKMRFYFNKADIHYATHVYVEDRFRNKAILELKNNTAQNISKNSIGTQYFTYMLLDYFYDVAKKLFVPLYYALIDEDSSQLLAAKPLTQQQIPELQSLYGPCQIEIPPPSITAYLKQELFSPFYIVQYVSVLLFVSEGYIQLGLIMVGFSYITTLVNYGILRNATIALKKKAHHDEIVDVIRAEAKTHISSVDLVPGDHILITTNMLVPCDCVLIDGETSVDEQSLTGESIPVHKISLRQVEHPHIEVGRQTKHTLFAGTRVVSTKRSSDDVRAIVIRVGFSCQKGQVFRTALFSKPQRILFFDDAVKFLAALAVLVLGLYFALLYKMVHLELGSKLIFFRFGDAVTWIVPPSLVIFVNLCMTATLMRLHYKRIFGTQPEKNMLSGTIDTICFDKTGTLTTDAIIVKAIVTIQTDLSIVETEIRQVTSYEKETNILFDLMASCHQSYIHQGVLLGDPIDLALVECSDRKIRASEEPGVDFIVLSTTTEREIHVIKVNGFESSLQMMSVVVRNLKTNKIYVFAKGAPERINSITLDRQANLQESVDGYAKKGLRVLAVAYKEVDAVPQTRSQCESELTLLGLLLLENNLKPDTAVIISNLSKANYNLKIISGDNPLTTISCAYQCNILKKETTYYLDYHNGQFAIKTYQYEKSIEQPHIFDKQPNRLVDLLTRKEFNENEKEMHGNYEFGLTGSALEQLDDKEVLEQAILEATIFARMKPDQKTKIVACLQAAKHNVAMVGDGANDCAAIKQADIGISFSNKDASNTAAFSSEMSSIECVQLVLLEGKATIANVVEAFKYFMIINVAKFLSVELLMYQRQNFNGQQFLYINYFSNIPLIGLIGFTGIRPVRRISHHILDSSMISLVNYGQLILIIASACTALIVSYFHLIHQSWYDHSIQDLPGYDLEGQANSVIFLSVNLQFLFSFVAVYSSNPFKPWIHEVKHIWIPLCILFLLVTLLYFTRIFGLSNYLDMQEFNNGSFMAQQYFLNLAFGLLGIIFGQLTWYVKYLKNE